MQKGLISTSISSLMLIMCGTYILYEISDTEFLLPILSIETILVFVISFIGSRGYIRMISILLFSIGVIIMFQTKEFTDIVMGITYNVPLLTMLMLVTLNSIPIKIGNYFNSIYRIIKGMGNTKTLLYPIISFCVFILAIILHLGSIKMLQEFFNESKLKLSSTLLAKSYGVAFTTVALWSPYLGSISLMIYLLNLSLTDYVVVSFPLALVVFIIGNIFIAFVNKQSESSNFNRKTLERKDRIEIMKIILLILMLILAVLLTDGVTDWPILLTISVVSLSYPILWAAVNRKFNEYREYFKDYKKSLSKMNNEALMFISAGIFAASIQNSAFSTELNHAMESMISTSFLLFMVVYFGCMLIITFIGIHPVITTTILCSQINLDIIQVNPVLIGLLFMVGWSMSALVSPTNPMNIVISNAVRKPALSVGFRYNGAYIGVAIVVCVFYIYVLDRFI